MRSEKSREGRCTFSGLQEIARPRVRWRLNRHDSQVPMPHGLTLISTLATAFGAALLLGFVAVRLRLPALVGYLVAGMLIGPFTPGFVADTGLASELAEIGVMLLMFGVGLHFSFGDLLAVRRIAVPGAIVQMAAATAMGAFAAWAWDWSLP